MGKYFVRSGYIIPQNMQSGTSSITTDASGDGTTVVTFPSKFKNTPVITLTVEGVDTTGTLSIRAKDELTFQLGIDGSALTEQGVVVDWIAMDVVKPKQ